MARVPNVISAFTEDQTSRLTGISVRQLRYWFRTNFFVAGLAFGETPSERLYSFRDLGCLRVINALRNDGKVSLQELREVKDRLSHLGDDLWAKTTLYVLNRHVIFDNPETETREEIVSGQAVLKIPLKVITGAIEEAVRALRDRPADLVGKIEQRKNVLHNQPVIAGTRILVRSVKQFAEHGYSAEAIRKQYPTLKIKDIEAAIAFEQAA